MKKVKDVFYLPVDASEVRFLSCHDRDPSLTENQRLEAAAHAINHVDALVDALEQLTTTKVINPQYLGQLGVDAINNAKAALAAYRGEL